jgi:hypothetical protein
MVERLAGCALLAAAMVFAGCVAQTGDESEDAVSETSALVAVPDTQHPDLPPPGDPDPASGNAVLEKIGGGDNCGEPEPNPWKPGTPGPNPGDPGTKNTRR